MIQPTGRDNGPAAVASFTGRDYIIGIDEVGLGACAGPLVVGAVVAPFGWAPERVKDSKHFKDGKKESAHQKRQEVLRDEIHNHVPFYASLWAGSVDIDAHGVDLAVQMLTYTLYQMCSARFPNAVTVLDGNCVHYFRSYDYEGTLCFPDADVLIPAVSAASIVAKTQRDHYMILLDSVHPAYGFGKHKGYVTEAHKKAMEAHGICEEHRRSYKNVARNSPRR